MLLGAVNVAFANIAGGEGAADGGLDGAGFVEPDDGKDVLFRDLVEGGDHGFGDGLCLVELLIGLVVREHDVHRELVRAGILGADDRCDVAELHDF